ncbi:FAD-binding oxidoreductase [Paenibacillus turpanensis]|uniref:FAD-binding oxidoreductase n=1 Tax=Paenibacillus turpanensis TaxID=2689078 RepID=UPI001FB8129B|nr:FAD-binding oxidoreductase [Paenibacillus turpanensis]
MSTNAAWKNEMAGALGRGRLLMDDVSLNRLSKDYYWYSPVLEPLLKDKTADSIVTVQEERDVADVLAFAYRKGIPVTTRGAGTGNYGQAVPLHGGIVLDMSGLDRVLEIGDGFARVQAGVRLGALERQARACGQELRIYPSTYMKATVGGFVCGGSGGIGSITWGNLWDGNVLRAVVYTMEETPRRLEVEGDDVLDYIHNYGTTGIVTELTIPLAKRVEWMQTIVLFDSFGKAARYSETVAADERITKRLVTTLEWPIPTYFKPIAKYFSPGCAAVLLESEEGTMPLLEEHAVAYGGQISHSIPAEQYRTVIGLSDFTWNHTTLWALKTDPSITYLQAGFDPARYKEQVVAIKQQFGDEVLLHLEWIRSGGRLTPSSLPIVKYTTKERLYEIIHFFETNGVRIFDPHVWTLERGGRGELASMIRLKRENDPLGLLNPGKLAESLG